MQKMALHSKLTFTFGSKWLFISCNTNVTMATKLTTSIHWVPTRKGILLGTIHFIFYRQKKIIFYKENKRPKDKWLTHDHSVNMSVGIRSPAISSQAYIFITHSTAALMLNTICNEILNFLKIIMKLQFLF